MIRRAAAQAQWTSAARTTAQSTRLGSTPLNLPPPRIVTPEDVERVEATRAAAEVAERAAAAIRGAMIPDRFRLATFGAARVPDDVRPAYQHAAGELGTIPDAPAGLYAFCGSIGGGKSHLACALVRVVCGRGRSAAYTTAVEYVEGLRGSWGTPGASERYAQRFARYSLLVVDEWQVRRDTGDEALHLLRLLDKRYAEQRTTLIISNHDDSVEFARSIDARLIDRLRDGGGFIPCTWGSLRGRLLPDMRIAQ